MRDLTRRESLQRGKVPISGRYAGATWIGRSLSVERWFAERAASLSRGAESEEEAWLSAWGVVSEKGKKGERKEGCESYAGSALIVGGVREVGSGEGGRSRGALRLRL